MRCAPAAQALALPVPPRGSRRSGKDARTGFARDLGRSVRRCVVYNDYRVKEEGCEQPVRSHPPRPGPG